MISLEEVLEYHSLLIDSFGGDRGVRDMKSLDAAIHRPYSTFDQEELYPSPVEKSAAILQSIVVNHPFVDGNKRTGYFLMRLFLLNHNLDCEANLEEKYEFVIAVSIGEMEIDAIIGWINEKLIKL